MKGQAVVHSSGKDDWETPEALFQLLDQEFDFQVDRAATLLSAKASRYYGPDHPLPEYRDALTCPWDGRGFLNPPYSQVGKFLQKAYWEMTTGVPTVALVAARPDTRYWHDYVAYADEVRFLKGRLKFESAGKVENSAPFPSAIVIFKPAPTGMVYTQRVTWWDWRLALPSASEALRIETSTQQAL